MVQDKSRLHDVRESELKYLDTSKYFRRADKYGTFPATKRQLSTMTSRSLHMVFLNSEARKIFRTWLLLWFQDGKDEESSR